MSVEDVPTCIAEIRRRCGRAVWPPLFPNRSFHGLAYDKRNLTPRCEIRGRDVYRDTVALITISAEDEHAIRQRRNSRSEFTRRCAETALRRIEMKRKFIVGSGHGSSCGRIERGSQPGRPIGSAATHHKQQTCMKMNFDKMFALQARGRQFDQLAFNALISQRRRGVAYQNAVSPLLWLCGVSCAPGHDESEI